MSDHTPGPWHTTGTQHEEVRNGDGFLVCKARTDDARLIAAAPDLLEALEDLLPLLEDRRLQNKARAAVAKATGQA